MMPRPSDRQGPAPITTPCRTCGASIGWAGVVPGECGACTESRRQAAWDMAHPTVCPIPGCGATRQAGAEFCPKCAEEIDALITRYQAGVPAAVAAHRARRDRMPLWRRILRRLGR